MSKSATRTASSIAALLVLLLGLALRVLGAWCYRNEPNADYAIVVEMVRNMAAFREWPVFFYGQAYMGSLEPSVSALFALLLGPSTFSVCLGTAFFAFLLLPAAYRWSTRIAGPWAGVASMALLLLGPPGYMQYMGSPRGGYALGLLLIVLLLDEATCLAEQADRLTDRPADKQTLSFALLGLYAGLAFWNFWLVLPAVAAAGVLLLAVYRANLFRPRVWLPGLLGFLLGSLPFWLWNATHGWASLASSNSGSAGLSGIPAALRGLLLYRLPDLLDPSLVFPWARAATVTAVVAAIGFSALLLVRLRRDRPVALFGASLFLFTAFFALAYLCSSFGQVHSPRYLLPFVPLFAVLLGTVFGLVLRHRPRLTPLAALPIVLLLALYAAPIPNYLVRLRRNDAFAAGANETISALAEKGVDGIIANYLHWSYNWAGDETIPVSTPAMERHKPTAISVERAERLAVLENFHGLDHFLAATGGTATYGGIGRTRRVHYGFHAPATVRDLPPSLIAEASNDRGYDQTSSLLLPVADADIRLLIPAGETRTLDLRLAAPTELCGIRVRVEDSRSFATLAIDVLPEGSSEFVEASPEHIDSGFFWSGPRPYWGGYMDRMEKRFPPVRATAVRLRMGAGHVVRAVDLSDIVLLAPSDAPLPDPDAIAETLRAQGARRVHADRWLGEQLRARLPESVWVSREPLVYGDSADALAIVPDEGTVLAVEPAAIETTRHGLSYLGDCATETQVGNVTLFSFRKAPPDLAAYRGALFNGMGLHHRSMKGLPHGGGIRPSGDFHPKARYFNGDLSLIDARRNGSSLDFTWFKVRDFQPPHGTSMFLHCLDADGRIVSQSIARLAFETLGSIDGSPTRYIASIPLPADVPEGSSISFGLFRPAFPRSRRFAPNPAPGVSVEHRRIPLSDLLVQP